MSYTRREFVKCAAMVGAGLALPFKFSVPTARAQAAPQVPLLGTAIPQFVDPLPGLAELGALVSNGTEIQLEMSEFEATPLPTGTLGPGVTTKTKVWGYLPQGSTGRTTHLGPIIVNERNVPTQIRFINKLPTAAATGVLAYKNSVDQTLAWADPMNNEANLCAKAVAANLAQNPPIRSTPDGCAAKYEGPVPACVHLHGGEVPAGLDGGPDAWWTSPVVDKDGIIINPMMRGHAYYTHPLASTQDGQAVYRYPNSQESAPAWFHDHTLGATRLNVYAGMAGGYLITDPDNDPALGLGPIPLIIQDRMFDTNGQLYFPAGVPFIPNPEHPYWVPEFLGDVILVNGKAWPFLNVEPKRYRFLFLNGSNARTYEMFLTNPITKVNGPSMWQIGTDGGYLDAPVKIDPNALVGLSKLVLMPGERADVIIDFAGLPVGTQLVLRNVARAPYPAGVTPNPKTIGRIIQFRVVASTGPDTSYNPAAPTIPLRTTPIPRLVNPTTGTPTVVPDVKRQLTLNEVMGLPCTIGAIMYPGGPLEVLVNNTKYMGDQRPDFTPIGEEGRLTWYSELPIEGNTEQWEFINLTADAHPMHFHLTQVQLLNRQNIDIKKYNAAYSAAFPGGMMIDGFGPPLDYNAPNLIDGAIGGNPSVTPFLKGLIIPPNPNEAGWKDTIMVLPGQVTRIMVRYAPTDTPVGVKGWFPFNPNHGHGYVVHCHIVDHEDNEMMRPLSVTPNPNAPTNRPYQEGGVDY